MGLQRKHKTAVSTGYTHTHTRMQARARAAPAGWEGLGWAHLPSLKVKDATPTRHITVKITKISEHLLHPQHENGS